MSGREFKAQRKFAFHVFGSGLSLPGWYRPKEAYTERLMIKSEKDCGQVCVAREVCGVHSFNHRLYLKAAHSKRTSPKPAIFLMANRGQLIRLQVAKSKRSQ